MDRTTPLTRRSQSLRRSLGVLVLTLPASAQVGFRSTALSDLVGFLDNGTIRIGVDLERGGAIHWLSLTGTRDNVINSADLGRYVQQSYYSGPCPYLPAGTRQHPAWAGWCWNPIQVGDVYGNPARLLAVRNDGHTLYTKCVPMQWALDDVPGECTFETWIELVGSLVVRVTHEEQSFSKGTVLMRSAHGERRP